MDASVPCGKFITEDLHVSNFVNNRHSDLEESYLKHELGAWNNAEETAEVLPGKDADDALIIAKDNLGIEELGTAFDGVFHIQDIQQGASNPVLNSHVEELGIAKVEKSFSKCATFPSKENTLLSPVPVDVMAESTITAPAGQSFQKSQTAPYSRSFSMPTSLNLVSAMKGSRERLGMGRVERVNVTWAPDVYDPPATSMSHTVRNHHQRPKSKKKDQKHRRKSKSTRGSGSDRKHHANWKNANSVDLLHLRFQVPASNRSPRAEGFDQMNLEAAPGCSLPPTDGFDRAAADVTASVGISGNQDSKCGRNFFGSSLSELHLSATEAT